MNRGEPLAVRCRLWVLVLALRPAHRDNEKSMPTWEERPQAVQVRLRTEKSQLLEAMRLSTTGN
jgi:hypothetical protein